MIHNIQIVVHDKPSPEIQAQLAHEARLIDAHRRGEHPYGMMRRDCPLCQLGK